ncbi:MAG: hypothetical protein K1X81_02785 [Bacteroidia bacterium]|nr:hypothetical protein [Bacteroidia bacterium]
MAIYSLHKNLLTEAKENPFKLEKDIQKLFEENLQTIFGLEFIKSEFVIKNNRIDTLAYDVQNKAFVIIEYKRDKNFTVIDQGVSYLSLMLENRADFIMEYNEGKRIGLKRNDVDWSQSKVIFVSTGFTPVQLQATNFKEMAIELWEVRKYENGVISINQVKKSSSSESIRPIATKGSKLNEVASQIKVYTEQGHMDKASDLAVELYLRLKNSILNLSDGIEMVPRKEYIAFKKGKNIVDVCLLKKTVKLWINLKRGELDDPKKLAKNVYGTGHWGNGDYQIQIENDKYIEYIMSLVKQAL